MGLSVVISETWYKGALITEEPDLEALFAGAVEEISRHVDEEDFDVDYGFQSEWDDQEDEAEDRDALELSNKNSLQLSV